MKNKILKIFVSAFIFLLPVLNVSAFDYYYKNAYIDISGYTNGSETWNITASKTHTADTIGKKAKAFWVHQAYNNGVYIHAYCLNVGKTANTDTCNKFDEKNFNAKNTSLSENKVTLLKKLLANATYHNGNISTVYNKSDKNKILATQILVWEVVEGARTKFDSYQPNKYHTDKSAYKLFVLKNKSVKDEYHNIIDKIQKNETPASTEGTIFKDSNGNTQIIPWNGSKYTKKFSIGKYKSCTSPKKSVTADVSGSTVTVSSSSKITSDVTITCTNHVGSSKTEYKYYDFVCDGTFQDLIRGESGYTYEQSFKVKTVDRNVKIIKYDDTGKEITGAKFVLKCDQPGKCGTDSFTYDLTNSTSKEIKLSKSGIYSLTETTTPTGRQKIPDGTKITLDIENGKASVSGGGGLVSVVGGNTVTIKVINTSKLFYVIKTDKSGNPILGATFQIRKGNTPVKFSFDGSRFMYNPSGTENIVNPSLNMYPISGLPDGTYNLVEVAVPSPYVLPADEKQRTKSFTVRNGETANISVTNYVTSILVNKIGNDGVKLPGVSFYLLDSTKTKKIKSVMTSSGNYNYSSDQNAGTESYTTNENGHIKVNYLPPGTYYFQEYDTGDTNYPVPTGEDAYVKFTIEVTSSGVKINGSTSDQITISNAKNEFCFYKVDENGNYLTGGKFKIQKYNTSKHKFEDSTIKKITSTDNKNDTYKLDGSSNDFTFKVNNGIACFKEMESSTQYRIVELEAPEGYEMSTIKGDDRIVVDIDSSGYVKTSTTMINKNVVKDTEAMASAELIINIQTGQNRIRYIIIISVLVLIIIGLFILKKKENK